MQAGMKLCGFALTRVRALEELGGRLVEMTHVKTGAELCWLDRQEENKAFCIAFKTIPEDSTGVFHILEHSVLCGSDKYPVKEPFVELLKTSVQTFLNAMTFPDKTVFPFSTRNDQDYFNLMDIYLDAVFHPAIYHKPEIFLQEGWRYENVGEQPVYQGVVLNEMKGDYASPSTLLQRTMNSLLLSDTCYRHESGGDPACIPDLSYEQFLAMHQKYYHPSNARISLVGSVDLERALEKLDCFLSAFDCRATDFEIGTQKPVAAAVQEAFYEIGPDESLTGRTILSCGTLLGSYETQERNWAASILADYLAGDDDAPLKRAILDAGLGQDMGIRLHDGIRQSVISWEVWNTDSSLLSSVKELIRDVLTDLADRGLDHSRLLACYNHFSFGMRDRDSAGYPRSVAEALELLDTWLYGGDPAEGLLVEDLLTSLRKKLDTPYFEDLIRELFLDDSHSATVLLIPSHTIGAENAAREAARIAAEQAGWTTAQKAELLAREIALTHWQQTPDSEEALAAIPMLRLSDMKEAPEALPVSLSSLGEVPLLRHRTSSSLARLRAHFDCSDLPMEELPMLNLLSRLLGCLPTARHSETELQIQVKQVIGALGFQPIVFPGKDLAHCRVLFSARLACLPEQTEAAAALLREILTETSFRGRKRLRDVLNQAAMEGQMSLASAGHQYAISRVNAAGSAHGAAREYLSGITAVNWVKAWSEVDDSALDGLLDRLEKISKRCFTTARLTLSASEQVTDAALAVLTLPVGESVVREAVYTPMPAGLQEIPIPAAVGFAAMGANLERHGRVFSGSLQVLASVLNYTYLWREIRVQGGAYGCGFFARNEGDAAFYTYRDPQPAKSLDVMRNVSGNLQAFCREKPNLTGFILGSVSALDPLLNTEQRISVAENRYFKGISHETFCRWYRELLKTTIEDLSSFSCLLDEMIADNNICVLAPKNLRVDRMQ